MRFIYPLAAQFAAALVVYLFDGPSWAGAGFGIVVFWVVLQRQTVRGAA